MQPVSLVSKRVSPPVQTEHGGEMLIQAMVLGSPIISLVEQRVAFGLTLATSDDGLGR